VQLLESFVGKLPKNGEKTGMASDTTRIDPEKDGMLKTAINIPSAKLPISMNQLSVFSEVEGTSGFLFEIDQLMKNPKTTIVTIARSYSSMRGSYEHNG